MPDKKVLMTGAAGYIADQLLPTFRERYDMVLIDMKETNRQGERVEGVVIADLIDPDRSEYTRYFRGVDAVVHLGYKPRSGDPLDHFFGEKQNVEMAYNVFRCAYDASAPRMVMASSNHAADWYEHALIHRRKMEVLDPYMLPLSDNFYGWAKATYEHMGFLFACGAMDSRDSGGREQPTGGQLGTSRKMGVVMVRIGAPRELDVTGYLGDPATLQARPGRIHQPPGPDTALHQSHRGRPTSRTSTASPGRWYTASATNTRAFWSLANAREVLGYQPADDSEVRYADDIRGFLVGEGPDVVGGAGRVGLV